jgi:quercetin dioxygenase-like cupin family protein
MRHRKILTLTCVLATALGMGVNLIARGGETVRKLFTGKLGNVPGNSLTAEVVDYPPGGKSTVHHHAGSVFAYVFKGSIRSQNSATGAARIYKIGESFFEPSGSDHLVSENASTSEPASLLAIHVAQDGAMLTKSGHSK